MKTLSLETTTFETIYKTEIISNPAPIERNGYAWMIAGIPAALLVGIGFLQLINWIYFGFQINFLDCNMTDMNF